MSNKQNRRDFMKAGAVGATALGLSAATYNRVLGAGDRIRVGFLGVGGRCQQHIDVILKMQEEKKGVEPVAVCDVWDGQVKAGVIKGRGLFPSAERCGIKDDGKHVTKQYEKVLELSDVDVVVVASPDHWHAKMAIDAMKAGKDVYCEKAMTRTIAEAIAVIDTAKEEKKVMTVGVQSMADPTWQAAYEYIREGKIGHVLQGQTSYYRNYLGGQWRYYPLTKEMTPKTIDWKRFLGYEFECAGEKLGPTPKEMPFDRAVWAQWRCYWPFGGGMFTDLFVHQTTHLIQAMGLRFPRRVVGAGGIYLEYDGRDVPDVATVLADYDEGAQVVISATMCNDTQLGEIIRGRLATVKFSPKINGDFLQGFDVFAQNISGGPSKPGQDLSEPIFSYKNERYKEPVKGKPLPVEETATYALWANFLECVRGRKRETLSTPELGAAAFSTVNMGVQSYRKGQVLFWDKSARKPVIADASWAEQWEARSKKRGKPNNIIGWNGGDKGCTVVPPEYQALEGPWVDGKEPTSKN